MANDESKLSINAQFKTAYQAYNESLKTRDYNQQIISARKAYDLGQKLYGPEDISTANLALNLAIVLNKNKQIDEAEKLEPQIQSAYEKKYGKQSKEIMGLYVSIASSIGWNNRYKMRKYYGKALTLAKDVQDSDPLLTATVQLLVGQNLLMNRDKKSKVILKALDYLADTFPATDKRVVEAEFWAGKYYMSINKSNKAIKHFSANLPVFENLEGATHPLELNTRAFLVSVLERKGRSEEATEHCVAIGAMTPWDDTQDAQPIYRVDPKYPISMARKGKSGYVVMEFTISKSGVIKDIIVKKVQGKSFIKPAKKALEQWRYAPKFVNGQAVMATEQTVRLDFKIVS